MCADVQEQHQDLLLQLLLINSAVNPDIVVDSDAEEEILLAGADQIQKSLPGAALLSNVQAPGFKDSGTKHKRTVAEVSKLCLWIVFSLCYLSESNADKANGAWERPRHHPAIQQVNPRDG